MRILTNIWQLREAAPPGVSVSALALHTPFDRLRLLWETRRADFLVIHFTLPDVLLAALAATLWRRCRIVTLDLFLPARAGALIRWALGKVTRFLIYFRDTRAAQQRLGVPAARFHYIPFKVNALDRIERAATADEGYIFVGGRSRRDFACLFAAVNDLAYPVRLLTGREAEIATHGSTLAGLLVPENVAIDYRDADQDLFVRLMAGARLVVLPLIKDCGVQAGIGVCLMGMALGKCVIISEGLGVSDVLTGNQALIVPGGDPLALRLAIERAWNDPALRESYAQRGLRYARSLGGEQSLCQSVLAAVRQLDRD